MTIKFLKLNKNAKIPCYAHPGDAGMDLYSTENKTLAPLERYCFPLGFALEIPEDFVAIVKDRSGMAFKNGIHTMAGVIDSNYRGEYKVVLINLSDKPYEIQKEDKIAQLLIMPIITANIKVEKKLNESTRGEGGFGASGRK